MIKTQKITLVIRYDDKLTNPPRVWAWKEMIESPDPRPGEWNDAMCKLVEHTAERPKRCHVEGYD